MAFFLASWLPNADKNDPPDATKALRRRRSETLTRGILWESPQGWVHGVFESLLRNVWDISYGARIIHGIRGNNRGFKSPCWIKTAHRSPNAFSNVSISNCTFFTLSSYSFSGTESVTIPPPPQQCIRPRSHTKVRIAMLVSIFPSALI